MLEPQPTIQLFAETLEKIKEMMAGGDITLQDIEMKSSPIGAPAVTCLVKLYVPVSKGSGSASDS
jgi:hypothetical protein